MVTRAKKADVQAEQPDEPKKLRFHNTGQGTHRTFSGKIIKPNEYFSACNEDVPRGIRHIVKCLDEEPEEVQTRKLQRAEAPKYEIKVAAPGWYNVVNSQGKKINERALRAADAQALKEELEG